MRKILIWETILYYLSYLKNSDEILKIDKSLSAKKFKEFGGKKRIRNLMYFFHWTLKTTP